MFVNFQTPNPGDVIANELRGKSYEKVTITKVLSKDRRHFTAIEEDRDKLTITYRGHISCSEVKLNISVLVVHDWKEVPEFILRQTQYIRSNIPLQPHLAHKRKFNSYYNGCKSEIKPNSKYMAHYVSDFDDLNFACVSKLTLSATYQDLVDMINYLISQAPIRVLKELTILYQITEPRSNAPFFNLSLLAGIKTRKLSLNNSKYIGFWKLMSMATIPYVNWAPAINIAHHHAQLTPAISEELNRDPEEDIRDNFVLTKFCTCSPYAAHYKKVSEIVIRNQEIENNRRFLTTKCCVQTN